MQGVLVLVGGGTTPSNCRSDVVFSVLFVVMD